MPSSDDFKRMAADSGPSRPYPPFPPLPEQIKRKFPDLAEFWGQWEKEIANWVKAIQISN